MPIAWVLNLDADLELAQPEGRYSPKASVRDAVSTFVPVLARSLLAPGDVLVDDARAEGLAGRAFCPTPRALALLTRAGAVPEPAPSFEVLRRVNSRAFSAAMGQTLPGARFVTSAEEARAVLATPPPEGDAWRIKRAFGLVGRGQRVGSDVAFALAAIAAEGGVQIEPNVPITEEYGIHGFLGDTTRFGRVVAQECDARGAWKATTLAAPSANLNEQLSTEARRVAAALSGAGYFGPFGVDAFVYRTRSGALVLNARSEINARYSMGYAIGMTP